MAHVAASDRYDDSTGMHYRRTGRSGLQLPALSLGLWQNFGTDRPEETQRAILRRAFDRGVTHFDLANNYGPPYGRAEENFGRYLADDFKPYRDELVISTKAGYDMWPGPYGQGGGSRKYVLASLDQSLERMGLDYVDIFYSHRFDADTPVEETMGALDTAVRSGRALYAGISSYSAAKTQEAAAIARDLGTPLLIHQPSYSMLNRWIEHQQDGGPNLLDELDDQGMGCIVFTALAQGLLTDRYLDGVPVGLAGRARRLDPGRARRGRARARARAQRHRRAARAEARPARPAVGAARLPRHQRGDRRLQRRAARHQPRRPRRAAPDLRRAGRDRPVRRRRGREPVGEAAPQDEGSSSSAPTPPACRPPTRPCAPRSAPAASSRSPCSTAAPTRRTAPAASRTGWPATSTQATTSSPAPPTSTARRASTCGWAPRSSRPTWRRGP